jgi:hypothetical protein
MEASIILFEISAKEKEFYIILNGWTKLRVINDDWWGNTELGIGYWHSIASAYELEMRKHEQEK